MTTIPVFCKNVDRTLQILSRCIAISAEYALAYFARGGSSDKSLPARRSFLSALAHELASQNMLFIKVFQYLSSFTEDFSPSTIRVFREYIDKAEFSELDDVDQETLRSVTQKYGIQLCNDGRPVNSASIAVVFRGRMTLPRLRPGAREEQEEKVLAVAIKLKKKGVERKLAESCDHVKFLVDTMKSVAVVLHFKPLRNIIDLMQPFVDNLDNLLAQCDFQREMDNMVTIKTETLPISDLVHIPTCYNFPDDRARETEFIVMEYIDGLTYDQLVLAIEDDTWRTTTSANPNDDDGARQLKYRYAFAIMVYYYYSVMVSSRLHVDMHLGNLFFRDKVCIIDFGMAESLDNLRRKPILDCLKLADEFHSGGDHGRGHDGTEAIRAKHRDRILHIVAPAYDQDIVALVDAKDKQVPGTRNMIQDHIFEIIIMDCIVTGKVNEYTMYSSMNFINRTLGANIQFKKYFYNLILGLAMTNKAIKNLVDFDSARISQLVKEAILYIFMDDDDDDDDEDDQT